MICRDEFARREARAGVTIPPHRTLAEIEKMAIMQTLNGRTGTSRRRRRSRLYRPTLYSK